MKTYKMRHSKTKTAIGRRCFELDSSALRLSGYFLFVSYFPHLIAGPITSLTPASSLHDRFSTFRAAMAQVFFRTAKTEKSGRSLWPRFCVPPVTKADTWATTVLFDENYARGFQHPRDRKFIGGC